MTHRLHYLFNIECFLLFFSYLMSQIMYDRGLQDPLTIIIPIKYLNQVLVPSHGTNHKYHDMLSVLYLLWELHGLSNFHFDLPLLLLSIINFLLLLTKVYKLIIHLKKKFFLFWVILFQDQKSTIQEVLKTVKIIPTIYKASNYFHNN